MEKASYLLIRFVPGLIFLSEGVQKFLLPELMGSGRFAKLGFPYPEILAKITGGFEIACGFLLLIGLFTRLATIPLLVIMIVAIIKTKIPLIEKGLWAAAHESRTDFAMTVLLIFLFINGSGPWSVGTLIQSSRRRRGR